MHPVLFSIGTFEVHAYGVAAGLAFLFGLTGAAIVGSREGLSWDFLWDLALVIIAGVVVGSRLEYVRTRLAQFAAAPLTVFDLRDGGAVFYGGLVGGVGAAIVYMAWRKQPIWRVLDLYAPFIAFSHAIGRVGCFAAGCCYGAPTDLPWGVVFPAGGRAPAGVSLHPTQLYEVGANVLLGLLLLLVRARVKTEGIAIAVLLLGYTSFRVGTELLRGDLVRGQVGAGITNGQAISAALFAAGAVIIWRRWPRPARTAP